MDLRARAAEARRAIDGLEAEAARERERRLRELQLAARSLRQAEAGAQWVEVLADAAAPMAGGVCFFRVEGDGLRCEAARGMPRAEGMIALADAPAVRQTVETKETVVALFAASQVSAAVAGEGGRWRRAHLFPLNGRTRVLGVLLAVAEETPDVAGLEVLLALAAASLEVRESKGAGMVGVGIAPAARPAAARAEAVPATAGQFARAEVARWMLDAAGQVQAGRARGDLYGELRERIDAAREQYRTQYLPGADVLHGEMIRQLARGDAGLMGKEYPGPLTKGEE